MDLKKQTEEQLKTILIQQQAVAWRAQRELQQAQQAEQAIYAEINRRAEEKQAEAKEKE